MNFLAHARLSFDDPDVLVGNMISDFVKGKKKFDYSPAILKGIMLHRYIDTFTDDHEMTKRAKEVFRPAYRLYSGAFVDVVYDHFLANDHNEFPADTLFDFSQQVYRELERHSKQMPPQFLGLFPYMRQNNWLYNYRTIAGTRKSFGGVVHRAAFLQDSETAGHLFEEHYQLLEDCYRHFWTDLKSYAREQYFRPDDAATTRIQ